MKMKPNDYAELKTAIESSPLFGELMDYRERGLSDKRYRWDCLWAVKDSLREWFGRVYEYLNDDHIDTALRKITVTER